MKLDKQDLIEFQKLVKDAKNAPVIIMKLGEKSWAEQAWDRVQYFMKDMAKKYNYDYDNYVINTKTGEIITIDEARKHEGSKNESIKEK
jgi:hypothetical protein